MWPKLKIHVGNSAGPINIPPPYTRSTNTHSPIHLTQFFYRNLMIFNARFIFLIFHLDLIWIVKLFIGSDKWISKFRFFISSFYSQLMKPNSFWLAKKIVCKTKFRICELLNYYYILMIIKLNCTEIFSFCSPISFSSSACISIFWDACKTKHYFLL